MTGRYLEEFAPGQKFASGQLKVDRERIKSFAAEFDPQPFHLNEEAARDQFSRAWPRAAGILRR
jgi:acyl dehydratase